MIPAYLAPLANHLWQSTLFVAGVGLLTLILRNNRAAVRHRLWLAASMKFLVPFSLLAAMGSHIHWRTPAAVAQAPIAFVIEEAGQPFTAPVLTNNRMPSRPGPSNPIPIILLIVWATGFLVGTYVWFSRWLRVRRAVRCATPVNLGLPIPVAACRERMEPGVFGVFRPVLLLPQDVSNQLSAEQMEAVITHELCHVRRRDNLASTLHMLVETLFWFHPFVWWIKLRLTDEQEKACDEEVLQLGLDPQVYAQSILKICELYVTPPLMCVSGIAGADLKNRIVQIMTNRTAAQLTATRKALLFFAALLLVCVPVLLGSIRAQKPAIAPSPAGSPTFEVASIKLNKSGSLSARTSCCVGGYLHVTNDTLRGIVIQVYRLFDFQLVGGPDWIKEDRFDIEAKADLTNNPKPDTMEMFRSLLRDRFGLKFHREMIQADVFILTIDKGGLKMKETVKGRPGPGGLAPGYSRTNAGVGGGEFNGSGIRLENLIGGLVSKVGRPIVDNTGLTGKYDFALKWTTPAAEESDPGKDLTAPDIFTAIREQLGLRLEPGNAPVEHLVIDSADKPTLDGVASGDPEFAKRKDQILVGSTRLKPGTVLPQTAASFEVATIKPANPERLVWAECKGTDTVGSGSMVMTQILPGSPPRPASPGLGRCFMNRVTLKMLISVAYSPVDRGDRFGLPMDQIELPPNLGWIDSERFDIEAKAEQAAQTEELLIQMLRQLLADRFNLRFHQQAKDVAGYSLVAMKDGVKLQTATGNEPYPGHIFGGNPAGGDVTVQALPISALVRALSGRLGRPVKDETGLTGLYDWELKWTPDHNVELMPNGMPVPESSEPGPSLFTAVQEQLGLRLNAVKVQVETMVINAAARPTFD